MPERYFNREQEAHMRYLGTIPREQRCASGWHLIGACGDPPCQPRRPVQGVADRITGCTVNAKCPGCQDCW